MVKSRTNPRSHLSSWTKKLGRRVDHCGSGPPSYPRNAWCAESGH